MYRVFFNDHNIFDNEKNCNSLYDNDKCSGINYDSTTLNNSKVNYLCRFLKRNPLNFRNNENLLSSTSYVTSRNVHTSLPKNDIYIINNEQEFEDKVMRSTLPVVINFHADWCEPCHALKPLLENLAEKFKGRMHLAEVKVDDHVALLQTFEVTAVPAVVGVVKGQVTEKFVGLVSEPEVRAFINAMIGE